MPSPAANRLTRAHQAELAAVGAVVSGEVRRIARTVAPADVDAWWLRVLPELLELVAAGFAGSRTLGARYLRQHAALEGVSLEPVLAQWSTEQAETSLRVTGPVEWKRRVGATGDEAGATRAMQTTLTGAAQRLAVAGSRDTVAGTVEQADGVVGWRRVTDADPCAFCALLASRGAVYRSAESAGRVVGRRGVVRGSRELGMSFHDHDQCTVEPLYVHEQEPAEVDELRELWERVTAGHSGAAAIREWRRWWDENRRGEAGRDRVREPKAAEPPPPPPEPPPAPPRSRNPAEIGGPGDRWWERLEEDTPDGPVPVRDLEIAPGYVVRRGHAWRIDGVAYLVEDGAGDADQVVAGFRRVHESLPGEAGQYQRAYSWLAGANPQDAHWAQKYNMPDFRSLATAGDGSVRVWDRRGDPLGPEAFIPELAHEFGHNVSHAVAGQGLGDQGDVWRSAGRSDSPLDRVRGFRAAAPRARDISWRPQADRPYPFGVTQYGTSSPGEDYAEAVSLYLSGVLGTGRLPGLAGDQPVYFRDLFPHRAAVLDQIFPQVAAQQLAAVAVRG